MATKIRRDGAATYTITAPNAQLQTEGVGPYLNVSLNDAGGTWDPETRISGGSIPLDREAVKALLQACIDFLVAP